MIRVGTVLGLTVAATALTAQERDPAATVTAFHAALSGGDSAAALARLDPAVIIFESGGAEMSAAEYAASHLPADMDFASSTARSVDDQHSGRSGDLAWVLTRSRTTGTFGDRAVDVGGVETMVLRRSETGWRIVHVHWSSRRR